MKLKELFFGTAILYFAFALSGCANEPDSLVKEDLENQVIKLSEVQKIKDTINSQKIKESPINTNKYNTWTEIDKGLYFIEMDSKIKSEFGNSKITILKISPKYYNFNLMSAKETKVYSLKTAKGWAKEKKLLAVINAGMFMEDYRTNMGYMKNYGFINNSKLSKDKAIISFNRKDKTVPEIQIIDLEHQNWDTLKNKYNSYTQGIRMIDINQTNRWSQQNKKWSMVCMGIDKKGNALFIFTRSPYSVHDFNNILLESPVNIYNLMYLEGGPEASFYLNHNGTEIERFGSYETGYNENDENDESWHIPNIIGITKK